MAYEEAISGYGEGYTGAYPGFTGPGNPDITRVINPRQPSTNNYLASNFFQLEITRLPLVTYFCQSANIPSLNITPAEQPVPFGTFPKRVGGRYNFEDLTVNFIVDEEMKNWLEVFRWMESIGNMEDYKKIISNSENADFFSHITLIVMNSAYKQKYHVRFNRAFPIALTGIDFTTSSSDTDPIIASATFTYDSYNIFDV
jgi:hypothetical protein